MTPDEWLAGFETQVADIQRKAVAFTANLAAAGATEATEDGAVRVSVAPNGALTGLSIADTALGSSGAELATRIMALARKAQQAAAAHVAASFAPLSGDEPPPPPEEESPAPARPKPANSAARDDDEDFDQEQIFGRPEEW